MPIFKTTCPRDCYDACGMIVKTDDFGNLLSINGDPEHPITKGFLCPRGAKDNERNNKNRVLFPSLKINNEFKQISWDKAIETLSGKIKQISKTSGIEKILYIDYAGNEGLFSNYFSKRIWNFLGVTQTDGALCTATGHLALSFHYGLSYGVQPVELINKNLIVFWGFNPMVSASHIWKLALKAKQTQNTKIVVIDPIRTLTSKQADLYLQIKPSTDTVLAYCIINQIFEQKKENQIFLKDYTTGYEELKEKSKQFTIQKTSEITGIETKMLNELVDFYINNPKSATMIGVALQKKENGTEPVRAISFIPAVLGIHRGFMYSNSRGLNVDTSYISGEDKYKPSKIIEQVSLADHTENNMFEMIFVNSMNPLVTLPNSKKLNESIKKNNVFLVVNETHWTKTAEAADLVLPVSTFLEKEDVMLSWSHNYTKFSPQIIKNKAESKSEVEIMQILANKLDLKDDFLFQDPKEVINKAFENAIEGDQKLFSIENNLIELKLKPKNIYQTKSGKIEFVSQKAKDFGLNELPEVFDFKLDNNTFVLLTTAVSKYTNSQFVEVYGEIPPEIFINIEDAERLNIRENEKIEIYNENGKVQLLIKISDTLQKNLLWMPRFTKDLNGHNTNCLISSEHQKVGKGPKFHSTTVKINVI